MFKSLSLRALALPFHDHCSVEGHPDWSLDPQPLLAKPVRLGCVAFTIIMSFESLLSKWVDILQLDGELEGNVNFQEATTLKFSNWIKGNLYFLSKYHELPHVILSNGCHRTLKEVLFYVKQIRQSCDLWFLFQDPFPDDSSISNLSIPGNSYFSPFD